MANLYLDIETVPKIEPTRKDLSTPAQYKKQESIDKYLEENYTELMEKEVKKRSLSLYHSKIVCLGYAFNKEEPQAITGKEDTILEIFAGVLTDYCKINGGSPEGMTIIGHNSKKFDCPILYLRSCLYDNQTLKSVFYFGRKHFVDTMEMGVFWKYGEFVSMDNLSKYFGLEGKGDINGSDVFRLYKEGKIEEIAKYCCEDVVKTRRLESKMMPGGM